MEDKYLPEEVPVPLRNVDTIVLRKDFHSVSLKNFPLIFEMNLMLGFSIL